MQKISIVTGGTSVIGLEAAKELSEKNIKCWVFSRHPAENLPFAHIVCDVSDPQSVNSAVSQVYAQEGRIDILINCAGFGISGAFEFTDEQDARRLMDVNLFGMSAVMQAVLPIMRAQGSGRIVNVGSIAGIAPIPFQTWYSVSKAAVHSLTMAVANEVRPFGITVVAAMPGDISTGFTAARKKSSLGDDVYGGRISRSVAKMEHDEQTGMSASFAGKKIAAIALSKHPKPYTALGISYKACAVLLKILPCRTVRWVLEKLYAG